MENKRKFRHALNIITFLMMTVSLFALAVMASIGFGAVNTGKISSLLSDSSFYDDVKSNMKAETIILLSFSEYPPEMADGIFDDEKTEINIRQQCINSVNGIALQPETAQIKERFISNISDYTVSQKLAMTEERAAKINSLWESIEKTYADNLELPYMQELLSFKSEFSSAVPVLAVVLCIVTAVLAVTTVLIQHRPKKGWQLVSMAFFVSALLTAALTALVEILKSKVSIKEEYFLSVFQRYTNFVIVVIICVSVILLLISGLLHFASKKGNGK